MYFLLGVGNPGGGFVEPIHSPRFDVDEACLSFALAAFSSMLLGVGRGYDAGSLDSPGARA